MKLSSSCFKDKIAQNLIETTGSIGTCDITGKNDVQVLKASELATLFKPLLGLYEPFRGSIWDHLDMLSGNTLFDCIETEDRWGVFSKSVSPQAGCEILDAIRGVTGTDGSIPSNQEWFYKNYFHQEMQQGWWHEFSKQLKHRRRFIPDPSNKLVGDPRKVLSKHLGKFEYTLAAGKPLYRARIGFDDKELGGHLLPIPPGPEMGAPPPSKATAGRANPTGVSYLYVAEQEATAIQEVRAYVGARVSVAKLEVVRDLKLISVAKHKNVFSAFQHPDLEDVLFAYDILAVLNEKLSQPVDPNTSHLDYLPTQYLAEVVLDNGYDGIRYKSAVAENGTNVVVFDQNKTAVFETKLIEVAAMQLKYIDLTSYSTQPTTPPRKVKAQPSKGGLKNTHSNHSQPKPIARI